MRMTRTSSKDIIGMRVGVLMRHTMNEASSCHRRMALKNLDKGPWQALDLKIIEGYMLSMRTQIPSISTMLMVGWKAAKKKRS